MFKIHPYAWIFVVVYFGFILFTDVYFDKDIVATLSDITLYMLPALVLYMGSPLARYSPVNDTVGNNILAYVAVFLLIIPLSCGGMKAKKERYQKEQEKLEQEAQARHQAILQIYNQNKQDKQVDVLP